MRAIIFTWLLLIGVGSCSADNTAASKLEEKLFRVYPRSTLQMHEPDRRVLTFCPDETCIEFRMADTGALEQDAFIYLYYFGDYYDLAKWRNDTGTQPLVSQLLTKQGLQSCAANVKKANSCVKKALRRRGLKVANTRYDEGRKTTVEIW